MVPLQLQLSQEIPDVCVSIVFSNQLSPQRTFGKLIWIRLIFLSIRLSVTLCKVVVPMLQGHTGNQWIAPKDEFQNSN